MRHLRFAAIFVCVFLIAAHAGAQSTAGSLSGTVVDASGNVVPGADVTVINESNGETRNTVSNETGAFFFPGLTPAPYTLQVKLPGFKSIERKNNIVLANNRLAIGAVTLEVGELAEQVTVTARGEVVATTQTSHQAILDLKQVENLSIRGRDPISLLKVLPGVALLANDQETFGGSFATAVPNIQGGRGQTVYVDGINGGDGGAGGNFSAATNMDAIAEVNVQMSVYQAEYGLKGGAQVNIVTKHGGNEYHGTGYWYKRHDALNATNFFNNRDGVAKPEYRYSTLGGNLGGPVPKVKKLFFFYSLDDTQLKDPNILRRYTMPTALERAGDFSQTRTASGALIVVRDPLTGQPFPGNIIPASRMDPRSMALINMLPLPNTSASGYNYLTQEPSIDHPRRQHLLRMDYRPTDNDTISGKYQSWYTKSVGWNVAGASARWGLVRQRYDFTSDVGKLDYTRVLGAHTFLEVNAGIFDSTENGPPENDQELARIQRATYPALATLPQFAAINNPLGLIPRAQFGTLQNNGQEVPNLTYDGRWPITGEDVALAFGANLTHTRGAHTFKMGILREHEQFGQAKSGTFAGEFSFANDGNDPLNAGYAYANAFLGHVTSYTESMGRVPDDRYQNTWAGYFQDTWKPNSHLTLDLGMRVYKWDTPYSKSGQASEFSFERFDPTWGGKPPILFRPITTSAGRRAVNPLTGEILPVTFVGLMVPGTGFTCGVITETTPCKINGIVIQEDGSFTDNGHGFQDKLPPQWDPRLGMAYAFNAKTVMRLGVGAFHDGTSGPYFQQSPGNPAFRFDRIIRFTDMSSFLGGTGVTAVSDTVNGAIRTGQKRPVSYKFQAAIQREIGWHTVVDVAYVGDRTRNIALEYNYNQIPSGARFDPKNRDLTLPDSATTGLDPNKPIPGALPDVFLRPILGFGNINISSPVGKSRYNSLQTQVSRRFIGGFELAGAYTWSRAYADGVPADCATSPPYCVATNPPTRLRTPTATPLPDNANESRLNIQEHVVVISYQIDLPKTSKVIPGDVTRWVLDNWRISGITTLATGGFSNVTATYTDNFDFTGGGDSCAGSSTTQPYRVVGDPNLPSGQRTVDRWFDTSVFKRATGRGDLGNDCNNAKIRLPGYNNHDLSLFKDFPMKRNQKMQFRAEVYNLFNQPQFQDVNTQAQFDAQGNQTNASFGKVITARNERRMQLSIRYVF